MRKFSLFRMSVLLGSVALACQPGATEQEAKEMCAKLVELRGEVNVVTVSDAVSVLDERFQRQEKEIETQRQAALEALEQERNDALAEAQKPDQKSKIESDFTSRQETLNATYTSQIDELKPRRETEVNKITERAELSRTEWERAVEACLNDPLTKGTTQRVVKCRLQASNLDEFWNMCR